MFRRNGGIITYVTDTPRAGGEYDPDTHTFHTLIFAGASEEEAIEFYRALVDLGKDVELVIFPREGHGIREPYHAMDRLRRYVYAFGEAVGVPPVSERAWEEALAARKEREKKKEEGAESAATATASTAGS